MEGLAEHMAKLSLEDGDKDKLPNEKNEKSKHLNLVVGDHGPYGIKTTPEELKMLGNFAYAKKNFDKALFHYQEAIKQDPNNMIYFLNIAAVHFERKEYEECIELGRKSIEVGKANKAEGRYMAKAYARIAKAYRQMGSYELAKENLEKALAENETASELALLKSVEKKLEELQRRSYIDPIKAEEENELGSNDFKEENYPEALIHFTEAVKCNPNNPKLRINRAACLAKMGDYVQALKDAEKATDIDSTLISAHIIKGQILQKINRKNDAFDAFKEALKIDPKNEIALFGLEENSPPGRFKRREGKEKQTEDKNDQKPKNSPDEEPECLDVMSDPDMVDILESLSRSR